MTRSALERSLPVETATEPIVAWRAWALSGRRDGSHLLLRPVVGRGRPWLPGRPAEAGCRMLGPFHEAPQLGCTCGLHGTHDLDLLRRTTLPGRDRARRALGPGDRTRAWLPRALRLPATPPADLSVLLLAVGDARGRADERRVVPRGESCSPCATSTRRWPADTGCARRRGCRLDEIDQRLRDTYAVDLLPR